jgi:cytochrome P450
MAGSETSATLLSGALFLLLNNDHWLAALQEEVRRLDEAELCFVSLAKLEVLNAVIHEAFRLYPPVPTILPRVTPSGGALVDGVWVPGNTGVGVAQYPANRSSQNFRDPDTFAPERWMHDVRYEGDALRVVQPFSVGPRNCLGQVSLVCLFSSLDGVRLQSSRDWLTIHSRWRGPRSGLF